MATSKSSHVRILAAERRIKAFELRKAGATFKQIAEQLGCSEQHCHKVVTEELQRLNKHRAELGEEVTRMELERLDTMLLGLWQRAKKGDERAVDATLKIMARRAKLCGLDAPTKIEQTGDVTLSVILPANETWSADADADSNEGGT